MKKWAATTLILATAFAAAYCLMQLPNQPTAYSLPAVGLILLAVKVMIVSSKGDPK